MTQRSPCRSPAGSYFRAGQVPGGITHFAGNRRARLIRCGPWRSGRRNRSVEVTYIITPNCVDLLDKTCIGECPVDCIYEGDRMLYIHPDECVDCGACEPVCPVEAIYHEDDVPGQW